MKLYNAKLFSGIFILLVYISIGVFGLFKFDHIIEAPMVDCPYTQNSFSVCNNSLDHINNWQRFSSVIFPFLFIFSLLILGIVLYFFTDRDFLNQKHYFYKWKYRLYNKKLYTHPQEIIKWLSLFENSPSSQPKA